MGIEKQDRLSYRYFRNTTNLYLTHAQAGAILHTIKEGPAIFIIAMCGASYEDVAQQQKNMEAVRDIIYGKESKTMDKASLLKMINEFSLPQNPENIENKNGENASIRLSYLEQFMDLIDLIDPHSKNALFLNRNSVMVPFDEAENRKPGESIFIFKDGYTYKETVSVVNDLELCNIRDMLNNVSSDINEFSLKNKVMKEFCMESLVSIRKISNYLDSALTRERLKNRHSKSSDKYGGIEP